jgi:HPt (histidine-containing phosphotransfer) domain-containing protein
MDKVLNFESLLVRLGDDVELVNEILNMFIDTIPEQMDILKSAVKKKTLNLYGKQLIH